MTKTKDPGLPVTADKSILDVAKDANKNAALNAHSNAVSFMTSVLSHVDVHGLVDRPKSSDWPHGQAQ